MVVILFFGGLAALIAVAFFLRNSKWIIAITLAALAAFPFYNSAAYNACEGGCNIRVDLLMVLPVLIILVLVSARMAWRLYRAR